MDINFKRFATVRRMIWIINILALIIIVGGGALALWLMNWVGTLVALGAMVILGLYAFFGWIPLVRYYKKIIIEETLKNDMKELEFEKSRFTKDFLSQYPLFQLDKNVVSDYYFLANYNGINLEIGNVISFNETKQKQVYIKHYSFNGKILSIPVETDEKASFIIIEKHEKFGSQKERLANAGYAYEIKTKNSNFNALFEIFSNQPDTDINPFVSIIIEVLRRVKKFCSHRVLLMIKDNRLFFAIDEQKGSYEIKIKQQVTSDDTDEIRSEYTPFLQFLDALMEHIK